MQKDKEVLLSDLRGVRQIRIHEGCRVIFGRNTTAITIAKTKATPGQV